MAHDHRVSYNVRLSIDQAYHIIDTDQTDAMDAGGTNFIMVEEEESMQFNHNSIQMITEEDEPTRLLKSKIEKIRDSSKRKTDQVKIPVLTGLHNSTIIPRGMDRKYTNQSQRPILTTEDEDDEARAGQLPDFGGNLQKPQTYTLFAIILGNIVLAKKNGIIVQDISAAQLENENYLIETAQNEFSQGPLQSGYFDFETEKITDSNNNPRMTQNLMMHRKNSQLTEIAEEEEQDLQYSTKPSLPYGVQRAAPAAQINPSYLSMGYGDKTFGDARKVSHDENSGHSSFNDPEQALNQNSSGKGSTGQRKTARISSPEEVKELKKLARKTVINDDAGNDEDGYIIDIRMPGMSMNVETQSNNYQGGNYSQEGSREIIMVDELRMPLMMNQDLHETTIERLESTKDKNPYEHRGSQLLPTNHTAMHERKIGENRVSLAPPTRKNNDDVSPHLGIKNRKSTLTNQAKINEEKKTKTLESGGVQKKNILSNLFSKFKRGGTAQASGQKGQNKQANLEEQMLESVTEFEMLHKVQLPAWVLTHEDYQLVEIPPIKNFTISERERAQGGNNRDTLALFGDINTDLNPSVEEEEQIGVSKKNFIIVSVIVIVAILFTVGIILAIAYTSA